MRRHVKRVRSHWEPALDWGIRVELSKTDKENSLQVQLRRPPKANIISTYFKRLLMGKEDKVVQYTWSFWEHKALCCFLTPSKWIEVEQTQPARHVGLRSPSHRKACQSTNEEAAGLWGCSGGKPLCLNRAPLLSLYWQHWPTFQLALELQIQLLVMEKASTVFWNVFISLYPRKPNCMGEHCNHCYYWSENITPLNTHETI